MTLPAPRVTTIAVPREGLLPAALSRIDYSDAFELTLEMTPHPSLDAVAWAMLGTAPAWVIGLMRARNAVVGPLGLKVDLPEFQPQVEPLAAGGRVGIFRVIARSDDELLAGEDDRHLDFRIALRVRGDASGCRVVLATAVRFNNWLGRAYFTPVAPMHRWIVPAMMRDGARRLVTPSPSA